MTDKTSKLQYLIDTGADVSVFPRILTKGNNVKSDYELYAANGSVIPTYGTIRLALDFKLRRVFTWNFVVAAVSKPIIGADFLSFYGLLPNLRNQRLVDSLTRMKSCGEVVGANETSIKTISGKSKYHVILAKFPDIIILYRQYIDKTIKR